MRIPYGSQLGTKLSVISFKSQFGFGAELPKILATSAFQGANQRNQSIKKSGCISGPGQRGPAGGEGPEGQPGLQF